MSEIHIELNAPPEWLSQEVCVYHIPELHTQTYLTEIIIKTEKRTDSIAEGLA